MTLNIDFAPHELSRLREHAVAAGKELDAFIHDAVMGTVDRPSISELLKPVHEATEHSGATVEEIDQMADSARAEARKVRKANKSI